MSVFQDPMTEDKEKEKELQSKSQNVNDFVVCSTFFFFFFDEQEILFTRQKELQGGNKSLFPNDRLKTGRAKAYIKRTKNIIHK